MKSWMNRDTFHKSAIDAMIADSAEEDVTVDLKLTEDLAKWLGQLTLLYGVPIEYLIPDHRMMPKESIRFFFLDRNWLDRLVDGAMSVGVLSTKEEVFNSKFFNKIYAQVDIAQQNIRSVIRGESTLFAEAAAGGTMSGLLIRSQVVTDYPGLEINAYDSVEGGNRLKILRMDRLPGSMILCIFNGVPEKINFIEPSEGLHFGVFADTDIEKTSTINLRGLGFNNHKGGKQLFKKGSTTERLTAEVPYVAGSEGVIDIMELQRRIKCQMNTLKPNNPLEDPEVLTSGGFAIQMVVTAGLQPYQSTVKNKKGEIVQAPDCGIYSIKKQASDDSE